MSGGQKQRVAIARALLKRPKGPTFDEATNDLNDETAEQLAKTVNLLEGQATMLFVTHRVPAGAQRDKAVTLSAAQGIESQSQRHEEGRGRASTKRRARRSRAKPVPALSG
ncbi:MAG TPA: ATP-binding cassette domain-containing protein [Burkholderiales bacterium]|nr:ATP-binding cassette domain-containing protein [Burkholderiales bacterium]